MSKAFTAIHYSQDPEHFLTSLKEMSGELGIISPKQFLLEDQYQVAIEGEAYKNLSFSIVLGGVIKAIVLAHKVGHEVRYNHLGVDIVSIEGNKGVINYALVVLLSIAKENNAASIIIDDRARDRTLSFIGAEAFNNKGRPETKLEAVIDLTQDEATIHKGLRKSYKSLVNQGRKEMTFTYLSGSNVTRELFNDFRSFHKQVAGRITRSQESWDSQFQMVQEGQAELILGHLDPHGLVSSALFNDIGDMTVYSVAVYNRDLFDYPLAHANVYQGVLQAKQRQQKEFYLGQIPPYGSVEEKEYNIGKFKKGFCANLKSYVEWHIPVE